MPATHVAGIIGGDGSASDGRIRGVAPGVSLISVRVLDEMGNGRLGNMLSGIEWIIKNRAALGIRIVNISVGTAGKTLNERSKLVQAVNAMWDVGLVVVTAAGNEGGNPRNLITAPGISRKVITVGASDDDHMVDEHGVAFQNYSGKGPTRACILKPEIVAPGTNIIATNAINDKNAKPYAVKSGTSMSTPIVSGAIALLLEKHPNLTNKEVKLLLRQSVDDMKLSRNHQGWGALNIAKLLQM